MLWGVEFSGADGFGRNDALIGGGETGVVATIANVIIKGSATGSAPAGDHFGIVAERVSKLKTGPTKQPLTTGTDDILLDSANGDFRVREVASII